MCIIRSVTKTKVFEQMTRNLSNFEELTLAPQGERFAIIGAFDPIPRIISRPS